jgi:hypothetical protein
LKLVALAKRPKTDQKSVNRIDRTCSQAARHAAAAGTVAIHSRPFEQPFRTGSDTRYHPDPPQISRTDTRVSPADGPSAWDKTGGAGGGKCRRKPTATAPYLPRNRPVRNSISQPLWQTNRGICSSTALSPACLTAINAVIGAIFSTCATASDDIQPALATLSLWSWAQKVHTDLRKSTT